jgi:hypothetical protein
MKKKRVKKKKKSEGMEGSQKERERDLCVVLFVYGVKG